MSGLAQSKAEITIRQLEEAERKAVLEGDTTALYTRLWWPEILINNPSNQSGDFAIVSQRFRTGKVDYVFFNRTIERIAITGHTAVVMGEEQLQPKGKADNAGKTITRRFMNVWQQRGREWRVIGRQATVIKVE